eukprot:m.45007 g.45007  ORF g.45007 m.45007 type:complete len:66 (-) comp12147_c0_seq2:1211-1408(-)
MLLSVGHVFPRVAYARVRAARLLLVECVISTFPLALLFIFSLQLAGSSPALTQKTDLLSTWPAAL